MDVAALPRAAGAEPEATPRCRLSVHPWAEFFGLGRDVAGTEAGRRKLCGRVTAMIPLAARRGYRVERVLSRGAYGIVFVAAGAPGKPPAALKLQFVCPKRMRREERARCGGYGQRASPYQTVRYEARTHADVHQVARAVQRGRASAGPELERAAPVPRVPAPIAASRLLLGRRGEFPDVPPDGRRRLWVSLMEFVPHPSLRHAVLDARDRGALSAGTFLALLGGVARHLAGMHARLGYTHGDAHSGNFLVDLDAAADGGAGWVHVIDLERAVPRTFLQLTPGLGTRARRRELWHALRLWDLKVFCESVVALAETARVWRPAETRRGGLLGSSSAPAAPPLERLRRGMVVAQAAVDAYEQAWGAAVDAFSARTRRLRSAEFSAARATAPPELLLAWVARSLYLKHKTHGSIPAELEAGQGAPLAGVDVRGIDRKAHREFFALLRAAQSLSLAAPADAAGAKPPPAAGAKKRTTPGDRR